MGGGRLKDIGLSIADSHCFTNTATERSLVVVLAVGALGGQ